MTIKKIDYKDKETYPQISLFVSLALLLLTPFINRWLSIFPFLIQVYRLIKYDEHVFMVDIVFLLPFASIFMIPSWGTAIGTLIILDNIWIVIKKHTLKRNMATASLATIIVYLIFRMDNRFNDFLFISNTLIFVMFMLDVADSKDAVNVEKHFVRGVLISSIYGFIFQNSSAITQYISTNSAVSRELDQVYRFRGLCLDSNYYSVYLVLSMVLVIQLYLMRQIRLKNLFVFMFLLSFFGVQTYSRTFFVMLVVVIFFLMYCLLKQKKYILFGITCVAVTVLGILSLNGTIDIFNVVLQRLFQSKGLNNMTSGRTELWAIYGNYIFSNLKCLFFGEGLGAGLLNGIGVHNVYLETVYFLGTFGFFLYMIYLFALIYNTRSKYKTNKRMFNVLFINAPLFTLLILNFSLQGIFASAFYIQIFVALISRKALME